MMNRILFERVQHCLGAPLTLGAQGKLLQLPPLSAALSGGSSEDGNGKTE